MQKFISLHRPYASFVMIATLLFFLPASAATAQTHNDWEGAMQEFEALDLHHNYPDKSIFFTGSSSIRLWNTLAENMSPYPVIQRGFGGSKMPDLLYYADRYISGHTFQALVLFVANDITGNPETDLTPERTAGLFEDFILKIRDYNRDAPIFIIQITPTNSRWNVWPKISRANALIARLCDRYDNVIFIPTKDLFLGETGRPMDEMFRDDRLHLNEKGYVLWTNRIRSYLDPVLQ